MPQDQGKLGDLLTLLAQLEEGLLAGVLVEEVCDVGHGTTVVLGHVGVVGARVLVDGVEGIRMAGRRSDTVEVGLLGGGGGGSSLLSVLVMRLLVHPGGGFLGVVMLTVHGVAGHHLDLDGVRLRLELGLGLGSRLRVVEGEGGPPLRASLCRGMCVCYVCGCVRCGMCGMSHIVCSTYASGLRCHRCRSRGGGVEGNGRGALR